MRNSTVLAAAMALAFAGPAWAQADGLEDARDVAQEFPEYVFACPDGGYQTGCDASDLERAIDLEGVDAEAFAERCLYATQASCDVLASGRINRADDAAPLHWQILGLQPKDGPYAEMIVLADIDDVVPHVLLSQQVEGYLDPPVAAREGDGKFLLHVPARNRGLGSADLVLFTSGSGWNWTSAEQIAAEIDARLPSGFLTASPIVFNFREGSAFALVRRDEDAGCCATGGIVTVDFEQGENTLDVVRIGFQESQPVGRTLHVPPVEGS